MKKILIVAIACLFIDQLIKTLITINLSLNDSISIISGFFSLTFLKNTGAAFNILSSSTTLLILTSLGSIILLYWFFIRKESLKNSQCILYGILIGGILGNLLDRIFHGYVIDYLDLSISNYSFPVFNFADMCIVISIFIIIIIIFKGNKHEV